MQKERAEQWLIQSSVGGADKLTGKDLGDQEPNLGAVLHRLVNFQAKKKSCFQLTKEGSSKNAHIGEIS